jgi:hypothetical protein
MTIAQLIILLILAAAWPFALSTFLNLLQAAVPAGSAQSYQLLMQVASFASNNSTQLTIASILLTAIIVAWRGYD